MNEHLILIRRLGPTVVLLAMCALAGCSTYSKISEKPPIYRPTPGVSRPAVDAEADITNAMRLERRDPLAALAGYIKAAEITSNQLIINPKDVQAKNDYNFAVGRIIDTIRVAKLDPWAAPLRVPSGGGDFYLTHKPDPRPTWNPQLYTFTPADQFDVRGSYVNKRTTRDGIGAPTVAIGRSVDKGARFRPSRIYYGVTTVARFEGRRCVLAFEDPLAAETTRMNGKTYPLAADFTVPIAVMLAESDPKKLEIPRLLNPAKYAETARVIALQPYDPNKTVLLFVHGLMDTQATWTPMINTLRGDPDIRKKYQFWFYTYPSGYPYPYSAAILRRELDALEKRFPLRHKMVVIGHSMGGCISRILLTDSGDKVWIEIFNKKPAETPLSDSTRKLLTEALIFPHRQEIGRVVFISAPLKGSDMATHWLGRIGSSLVRSPVALLQAGNDAIKAISLQSSDLRLKRIPNSVDTLSPKNRFVMAINTVPIASGIPYHTIIGDRGKGDSPNSSDGIVPYWSSHMDGAESELIVPSGHSAHQNPQAIEEVRRILLLNAH